jgi:acetyl-CoA/propionyl-CoA carboxylase biotin carboxyl carrier protein
MHVVGYFARSTSSRSWARRPYSVGTGALLSHKCFISGETCAAVLESGELMPTSGKPTSDGRRPASRPREVETVRIVELDGRRAELRTFTPEPPWRELARHRRTRGHSHHSSGGGHDTVVSPLQGTVLAVSVAENDEVEAGDVICIVEAMKMENEVRAPRPGRVTKLVVDIGDGVATGQVICVLEDS